MKVDLRPATADDAEQIGVFQTRAWADSYAGIVPESYLVATTAQIRAVRWRERLATGHRQGWLAHTFEGLVGVASVSATPADRPDLPPKELNSIYVDRMVLGRGVAQQLMGIAIGDGPAHLWVFAANARAQRFYARQGSTASDETQIDQDTGVMEVRWVRR